MAVFLWAYNIKAVTDDFHNDRIDQQNAKIALDKDLQTMLARESGDCLRRRAR